MDLLSESGVLLPVLTRLDTVDLSRCVTVCKAWSRICQDPQLWTCVRLMHRKITSHLLSLIVQRQPVKLCLDWSTVSKQQLTWLLPRIPQTRQVSLINPEWVCQLDSKISPASRSFSLCGVEYNATAVALNTVNCPMLQELNLGYVTNFNDSALYKLLSSPKDSRPGWLFSQSHNKI